jgi:hypothetical protein
MAYNTFLPRNRTSTIMDENKVVTAKEINIWQ